MKISRREVLNFHISGSIRHKKALEAGKCSVDTPDKTSLVASELYVGLIKASHTSCVITDSLDDFEREVFNFHIFGFIRHKKALETGKCSVFKLLFPMKFILTRQTRRAFLRANCMSGK